MYSFARFFITLFIIYYVVLGVVTNRSITRVLPLESLPKVDERDKFPTHILTDMKGLEPAASHGIVPRGQAIVAVALALQDKMRYHTTRTNLLT